MLIVNGRNYVYQCCTLLLLIFAAASAETCLHLEIVRAAGSDLIDFRMREVLRKLYLRRRSRMYTVTGFGYHLLLDRLRCHASDPRAEETASSPSVLAAQKRASGLRQYVLAPLFASAEWGLLIMQRLALGSATEMLDGFATVLDRFAEYQHAIAACEIAHSEKSEAHSEAAKSCHATMSRQSHMHVKLVMGIAVARLMLAKGEYWV